MKTTPQPSMQQRLNQARDEAAAALEKATDELQTAQLQAVAMNVPVPGKLNDNVRDARRRLSDCEGALIAFAKSGDTEAAAAWRVARDQREAAVAEVGQEFLVASQALVKVIDDLLQTGPAAELVNVLRAFRAPVSGASVNVLTPSGWVTSEALRQLVMQQPDQIVLNILHLALYDRRGLQAANEFSQKFVASINDHIKAQPDSWPAA